MSIIVLKKPWNFFIFVYLNVTKSIYYLKSIWNLIFVCFLSFRNLDEERSLKSLLDRLIAVEPQSKVNDAAKKLKIQLEKKDSNQPQSGIRQLVDQVFGISACLGSVSFIYYFSIHENDSWKIHRSDLLAIGSYSLSLYTAAYYCKKYLKKKYCIVRPLIIIINCDIQVKPWLKTRPQNCN